MEIMPSPGFLSGSACSFASSEDDVSAITPPPDVMRLAFASVPVTERLSPVSMLTLRPWDATSPASVISFFATSAIPSVVAIAVVASTIPAVFTRDERYASAD